MVSERIGKYACLEKERRYLLRNLPGDFTTNAGGWQIVDRYFPGTRLRLRYMESLSGIKRVYKLTQKYRSETQSPLETTITNLYLTEAEYNLFNSMAANILKKRRYPYRAPDRTFSIDVFEGRHQGLILAEIEFENEPNINDMVLPKFAQKDVTDDPFFNGGNLAMMTDEEFQKGLVQKYGGG